MANTNDFKVILEAMIDKSSLTDVQKQMAKERLKINVDISVEDFTKNRAKLESDFKELGKKINAILGKALDDPIGTQWARDFYQEVTALAEKSAKKQVKALEQVQKAQEKQKTAEQEKYYKKLGKATKEQLEIEKQRITAGEKQLEILDKQNKRRKSRISYNEGQIDKKGLTDVSKQSTINDISYSGNEKYDVAFAKEIDKNISNLSKLKEKWQEQGIYVDEFKTKVETLEKSLNDIDSGDVKGLNSIKQQMEELSKEASQIAEVNNIQLLKNEGKFTSQISDVTVDYNRLSEVTDDLKADFKELNRLCEVLNTSADADELRQSYEQFNTTLQKVKNSISMMDNEGLMYADQKKIDSLAESVLKFRDNNTKMSKDLRSKFTSLYNSLINGAKLTDKQVDELVASFTNLKLRVREAGQLGQSFGDKMKNAFKKFSEWGFATGIITSITSKFREAITELKEIDTLLTEISKANDKLSTSQLSEISDNSFDIASRYGKKASNYLSGIQEASRAGYENAEAIAELSVAIQGAGDVTEDVANSYVIATDKAYKLGGSVEALTEIFDGTNKINKNGLAI